MRDVFNYILVAISYKTCCTTKAKDNRTGACLRFNSKKNFRCTEQYQDSNECKYLEGDLTGRMFLALNQLGSTLKEGALCIK